MMAQYHRDCGRTPIHILRVSGPEKKRKLRQLKRRGSMKIHPRKVIITNDSEALLAMSNTTPIVPKNFGPPPAGLDDMEDDVLQGTRPSFAVLAMPSKGQWAFRYQRMDSPYQDDEGNNIPNIEVVIVKSKENLSNNYYIKYNQNEQHKAPDCWSSDGQTPDARVPEATKQNPICAGCPQKKPGSAITAAGDPTKACRDVRKIAVIPIMHLLDRKFDEYGGPMLYTITPTSLKNYAEYLDRIKAMGHKSFSVVTRMRFDPNVKFQKIVFSPHRALSDEESEVSKEMRRDPRTARVLDEEPLAGQSAPPDEWDNDTGEVIVQPKPKPPAPTKAQPAVQQNSRLLLCSHRRRFNSSHS